MTATGGATPGVTGETPNEAATGTVGGPTTGPVPVDVLATLVNAVEPMLTHRFLDDEPTPRVTFANPAFLRLTGFAPEELIGQPSSICWDAETDTATVSRVQAALRRGETVDAPVVLSRRDGTPHRGRWHFIPVRDPDGRVRQFVSALRDATDAQRLDAELTHEAAVGQTLFASHLDAVYELDPAGHVRRANAAAAELVQCEPAAIVGRSLLDFIAEEDRDAARADIARALGGESVAAEHVILRCGGERRVVRAVKTPVMVDGLVVGVYGICQDVTDARRAAASVRESESRYRVLVEQSPECVSLLQDGAFAYVNRSGAYIHDPGRAPEDFVGVPWRACVHREDWAEVQRVLDEVLAAPEGTARPLEKRIVWPDGTVREFEGMVAHVTYGGRPATQSIGRDVTEQRRVEGERRRAQRFEALGRLAAGVAHDFNNLLAVMLGAVELATYTVPADDEALRDDLAAAADAARRGRTLTRQLLTFARREGSTPTTFAINDVVRGMSELLRRLAGGRVAITFALDPDAGAITADPGQFEQVLLNLVTNARDAMPDGGTLTIETARADGMTRLSVRDTGIGIAPEARAHLFEPFFSTKAEGHGLGLATVYGVTTAAGGAVEVESESGRGTAFHLYFPATSVGD